MKSDWSHLDKFRTQSPPYVSSPGATYGAFVIPRNGVHLRVIATDGDDGSQFKTGWEHVSCHVYDPHFGKQRCPNWAEMCFLKDLFWNDDEVVVQLHVAKKDYVNVHPSVLHLWRLRGSTFPTPPIICV